MHEKLRQALAKIVAEDVAVNNDPEAAISAAIAMFEVTDGELGERKKKKSEIGS